MDTIIANNKIQFLKSEIVKFVTNGGKIQTNRLGNCNKACPIGAIWINSGFKTNDPFEIYNFIEDNYGLDYNFFLAFDYFIAKRKRIPLIFNIESENAFVAKKIAEFCIQNNFIK